jgi:glycine hydroxymethyltransferase
MWIVAPKSGRTKLRSELLDSMVMPGIQGGPLMHVIAAKAVAFGEALQADFKNYAQRVIDNAKTLAGELTQLGYQIVSGGTDNHVMLIDLTANGLTGKLAEQALHAAGITANKNMVPFDTRSPFVTSGIRLGTPALTTRGFGLEEMRQVAAFIDKVLRDPENDAVIAAVRAAVSELASQFPLVANEVDAESLAE